MTLGFLQSVLKQSWFPVSSNNELERTPTANLLALTLTPFYLYAGQLPEVP